MVGAAIVAFVLASPAYVQSNCSGLQSVSLTSPVAAGDLLVAVYEFPELYQVTSITDTLGSAFTTAFPAQRVGAGASAENVQAWYAVAPASGADTVTFTYSGTPYWQYAFVHEYSGVSYLERVVIGADSGSQGAVGPLAGLVSDEVVFAFSLFPGGNVVGVSNGFTGRQSCNTDLSADQILSDGGAYAPVFSYNITGLWELAAIEFGATPVPDGGALAGGGPGGGPGADGGAALPSPLQLAVGCGCQSGRGLLWGGGLIASLLFALRLRRRTAR